MKAQTGFVLVLLLLFNCGSTTSQFEMEEAEEFAIVKSVKVSGNSGEYTFSVELKSPDKGCTQYANWWEVITPDGQLIYRRVLGHSHVDEQPFTRSGGKVKIADGQEVIVRAHMHPGGYGSGKIAMKGSVQSGFIEFDAPEDFASDLEDQQPLPTGCAF